MFSDDSYVDLAQQGVFYNSIDGANDLGSQRYGNHDDYFVLDCSAPGNQNEPGCQEDYDPSESGLFAGGEDGVKEFEAFNPDDVSSLCENNPQDPLLKHFFDYLPLNFCRIWLSFINFFRIKFFFFLFKFHFNISSIIDFT